MPDGPAPLYCDEDVSVVLAAMLRARGFLVTTARDSGRLGRSDEEQLTFAAEADSVAARYEIELRPAGKRDLVALPRDVLRRVDAHLLALSEDPYPRGAKKLEGPEGVLRVRVGDYRIIYRVDAATSVVGFGAI